MNVYLLFLLATIALSSVFSFQPEAPSRRLDLSVSAESSRRQWLVGAAAFGTSFGFGMTNMKPALAEELEMKDFVDPQGLFSLRVPKNFYTLRRTVKGDLPDAKTGKGRRGSSIFTAGNMAKAEVVAVERYPVRVLLEENGIDASGDLSSFKNIGEPRAIASLLIIRREKETQNQLSKVLDDVQISSDGKELTFRLRTEIEVQKPELLMEQMGVSQLFRVTIAKASLNSNDGNVMAVFASALEQDFNNGLDGPALQDTVNSFVATEQPVVS